MAIRKPDIDAPGAKAEEQPRHAANRKDVRAGPGDAGRQDRPDPLPKGPRDRARGRQAVLLLAALFVFGILVMLLMSLAG